MMARTYRALAALLSYPTAELQAVAQAGARVWRITIVRGGQTITATFGG